MLRLIFETVISAPPQKLWEFHSSVEALTRLSPPGTKVEVIGEELAVKNGAVHRLRIRRGILPLRWDALISEVIPGRQFRDTALKSPFKSWTHLHEFLDHPEGALLRDTVEFSFHIQSLEGFLKMDIESMFAHRHRVTKELLALDQ